MRNYTQAEIPALPSVALRSGALGTAAFSFAPPPVLSSTQFCLELMTHGGTLDLNAAVDLLGRDPGAVLRLFRRIAQEFPNPAERPYLLKDCVVSLPTRDLLETMQHPASLRMEQAAFVLYARHAHAIGHHAASAAASLGLEEDRSFLVGLFHDLGTLPTKLRRMAETPDPMQTACWASAIAAQAHLPSDLCEAIAEVHHRDPHSHWTALMQAAHDLELATASSMVRYPS